MTSSNRAQTGNIINRTIVACTAATTVSLAGLLYPSAIAGVVEAGGGEVASTSDKQQSAEYMEWALRESFINYVGGATSVSGGASKTIEGDALVESGYRFTLKKVSYDEDTATTRAEFNGAVHFLQYCNGSTPARGSCDLDLEFSDPTIVVGGDSYLEMDVYAKQYRSGDVFEKKRARIATINPSSATFTQDGSMAQWSNLVPTLTADGVRAFSNFYNLGSPLAPVSFAYEGSGGMPAGAAGGRKLVGGVRTDLEAESSRAVMVGDYLVLATKSGLSVLDVRTMQQIQHLSISSDDSAWVVSPGKNTLFFLDDGAVKQATVGPKGLENITEVIAKDEAGTITGIASAPTEHGWVLYALRNEGAGNATLITRSSDGTRSDRAIANVRSSIDGLDAASDQALGSVYGESYSFAPMRDMAVLDDGSLLFFPASGVDQDEDTWRVPPLRIDPAADNLQATVVPGSDSVAADMRPSGMAVSGGTVAFYNSGYTTGSQVQFFTYNNGELTPLGDAARIGELHSISGVVPLGDGTAVVTAESDGSLNVVDMRTLEVIDKQTIPNTKGTSGTTRVLLVRSPEDIITGGVVTDTTTYKDFLEVNRFATSEALAVDSEAEDEELLGEEDEDTESEDAEGEESGESTETSDAAEPEKDNDASESGDTDASETSSEPSPSEDPSTDPSEEPSEDPSEEPSSSTEPSAEPSDEPSSSAEPSEDPSEEPSPSTTAEPGAEDMDDGEAEEGDSEDAPESTSEPAEDNETSTEPSESSSTTETPEPSPAAPETSVEETPDAEDTTTAEAPSSESAPSSSSVSSSSETSVSPESSVVSRPASQGVETPADTQHAPKPVENSAAPTSPQGREAASAGSAAEEKSGLARTGAAVRGMAIVAGLISAVGVALIVRARVQRSKNER
ncbi:MULTISPECIES: HtaA domain-containing protein [Corynebacterium]|uniref:HtaA domain-containing protein n=1 Tax=Corynebacterium TaxID=1716 RepID=UPI00178C5F0F|nr:MULTISPECIES: HtaA domain-containing protein [Corynebacterium]